jgi:hypothetical protein
VQDASKPLATLVPREHLLGVLARPSTALQGMKCSPPTLAPSSRMWQSIFLFQKHSDGRFCLLYSPLAMSVNNSEPSKASSPCSASCRETRKAGEARPELAGDDARKPAPESIGLNHCPGCSCCRSGGKFEDGRRNSAALHGDDMRQNSGFGSIMKPTRLHIT